MIINDNILSFQDSLHQIASIPIGQSEVLIREKFLSGEINNSVRKALNKYLDEQSREEFVNGMKLTLEAYSKAMSAITSEEIFLTRLNYLENEGEVDYDISQIFNILLTPVEGED